MEGLLESFCLEVPSSLLQKGGKGGEANLQFENGCHAPFLLACKPFIFLFLLTYTGALNPAEEKKQKGREEKGLGTARDQAQWLPY